jgi:hypothetical protein
MLTLAFLCDQILSGADLAAENLALRQQVAVLRRTVARPRLRIRDRLFWVVLSRIWGGWRGCLLIVRPATGWREGCRNSADP